MEKGQVKTVDLMQEHYYNLNLFFSVRLHMIVLKSDSANPLNLQKCVNCVFELDESHLKKHLLGCSWVCL